MKSNWITLAGKVKKRKSVTRNKKFADYVSGKLDIVKWSMYKQLMEKKLWK